jgi:hypothetical protein
LFVYARAEKLSGLALLRPTQLAADARAYLPQLGLVLGFGMGGTLLAVLVARRSQAARELAFATIAGLPLVLLVLGIGETPRHYIMVIATLVGLGAAGWVGVVDRLEDRRWWLAVLAAGAVAVVLALPQIQRGNSTTPAIILAAIVGALALLATWAGPRVATLSRRVETVGGSPLLRLGGVVIAVFLMGATISTTDAVLTRKGVLERAQVKAVTTVGSWVNANLPDGSRIITGSALAYELALEVHDHHQLVRLRPLSSLVDPAAPLGLRTPADLAPDDVLTLESALRNADKFDMYAASELDVRIRRASATAWVQSAYLSRAQTVSAPMAMLDHSTGVRRLQSWTFPAGSQTLAVVAYGLDLPSLALGDGRIYAEGSAISGLARRLDETGEGTAAAARLLARITPIDSAPATSRAMDELRAVADGS